MHRLSIGACCCTCEVNCGKAKTTGNGAKGSCCCTCEVNCGKAAEIKTYEQMACCCTCEVNCGKAGSWSPRCLNGCCCTCEVNCGKAGHYHPIRRNKCCCTCEVNCGKATMLLTFLSFPCCCTCEVNCGKADGTYYKGEEEEMQELRLQARVVLDVVWVILGVWRWAFLFLSSVGPRLAYGMLLGGRLRISRGDAPYRWGRYGAFRGRVAIPKGGAVRGRHRAFGVSGGHRRRRSSWPIGCG